MGESAVLLRSFSHPSDASREGDPICALTESISFGRFMSESLAWEKWSTFSHNRYLEEVEKFSKPGSVAEKKAYFEAHYKKKAAMKAVAVEEANAATEDAPELKTKSEIQDNSHIDTDPAKQNSQVASIEQKVQYKADTGTHCQMDTGSADMISQMVTDEQLKNNNANTEVAPVDANACYSIKIRDDLGDDDRERGETAIEYPVNVENQTQADNSKQHQNPDVHNEIEATSLERMPHKEAIDQETSASSSKIKLAASCSSKSSSESGVSRLTSYPTKVVPKIPAARNINNVATNNEEIVGHSNGKKRVAPKSLHKSINFSPRVSETSIASLKKPKDSSTAIRTPTRASVNGISKHLSKLFQSEDKRSKTLISKSVSGGIIVAEQLQSVSMEGSKPSSGNASKTRSPCISSPFSFRSEERAAKRKEFFQKLEEKTNTKEAEKAQLETRSKDQAERDIKKLRQSISFKAKQNEYSYRGSHLPNNHMKKEKAEHDVEKLGQSTGYKAKPNANSCHDSPSPTNQKKKKKPIYQPSSPKLGGKPKPTPTVVPVQDTISRPPRRPSVNTTCSVTSLPRFGRRPTTDTVQDAHTRSPWRSSMNTASFKHVIEKNNGSTNRSAASLDRLLNIP